MASKGRKILKTKSSIVLCTERYSCNQNQAEAVIICEDCGSQSKQCSFCDQAIHGKPNNRYHERRDISPVDKSSLCQSNCKRKNFADVVCIDCDGLALCHDCFEEKHPFGSKKHCHKKDTFQKFTRNKLDIIERKLKCQGPSIDLKLDSLEINSGTQSVKYPSDDFQTCNFQVDSPLQFRTVELSLNEDNQIPDTTMKDTNSNSSLPDIAMNAINASGDLNADGAFEDLYNCKGFLLLDQDETLQVTFVS